MEKKLNGSETVAIKSTINAQVGLIYPPKNIRREFPKKGAVQRMKLEDLEEALYDPGIEYLFKTGILYIENMDQKIYLGLEEEGTTVPTKILELTDADMVKYLTVKPTHELKVILPKMSSEQIKEMSGIIVREKITDQEKVNLVSKAANTDLFTIVANKIREDKIDEQQEK